MGKVFVFGMLGLVIIGLVFLVAFLAPIAKRWIQKVGK